MRAGTLVPAILEHLEADDPLIALLEDEPRIYRMGENELPLVPSLEYMVVTDRRLENTARVRIQFDWFAHGFENARAIAARLMELLHHETTATIGGIPMMATYDDSRDLFDPRPGTVHLSADFLFEPAKEM